jgi:hypothetical protein
MRELDEQQIHARLREDQALRARLARRSSSGEDRDR